MTAPVPLVERLAEVLAEHDRMTVTAGWTGSPDSGNPRNIVRACRCGERISEWPWIADDPHEAKARHRAHVARALLPVVEQVVTEARGEALREAADLGPLHFAATHTHRDARGWNVVEAEWLRARADEVTP